jgi:hypothetical protein
LLFLAAAGCTIVAPSVGVCQISPRSEAIASLVRLFVFFAPCFPFFFVHTPRLHFKLTNLKRLNCVAMVWEASRDVQKKEQMMMTVRRRKPKTVARRGGGEEQRADEDPRVAGFVLSAISPPLS